MVAISAPYPSTSYLNLATSQSNAASSAYAAATSASVVPNVTEQAATAITLSSAAQAALATKDFTTVLADTHAKLASLLEEAERTSPLQDGKLSIDLSGLNQRELFAMASDDSFDADAQAAAGLEMQRRFENAMSGPAGVAQVTGNFTALYKAAAQYLDSLGSEEKTGADWMAGRAAVTEGLKQLQSDPKSLPDTGDQDPVQLYLALVNTGQAMQQQDIADVASSARQSLDALYADAIAAGKAPTFNSKTTMGSYIDMSGFPSRTLSAIALNTDSKFTTAETDEAASILRDKSGAALLAGFQNAANSSDPTAFSQNIISMFSSMSVEERQAAGWSDDFYQAAVASYESTSKLTQMFAEAGGSATSFLSFMGSK
ncbi:hypothetical protein [Devosia neptuniae]|jgi:hypothetical protein|uniref:hypothetical protein n=1 Tax=Devosia TaxID=46913 RepID=UPI0022B02712|nr:hypothetical protein [Devosia neptuniae]MCZ4345740.1 hypothetical protein [Devosia neptuniae]|tara:strand:- start:36627 stop:37745 length:1119 start_codon:yes stop_codon:yes gene_type:complete